MADNYNLSVAASELNATIAKANAAAPQSTTYTKTQVDALVSAQTADKSNLAVPYQYNYKNAGVQFTRDDQFKVVADGTAGATVRYIATQQLLPAGSYIVSGCTDGIHPLDKGYNQAYIPLIRKALLLGTTK